METINKKILLVEDDPNFGIVLKDYLSMNDFDVTLAKNGMEGFEKFKKDNYDICILDVIYYGFHCFRASLIFERVNTMFKNRA